jgi:hypothetical protein
MLKNNFKLLQNRKLLLKRISSRIVFLEADKIDWDV